MTADRFELVTISGFFRVEECVALCSVIDRHVRVIPLESGPDDYRTSATAVLNHLNLAAVSMIQERIARAVGIKPEYCEGLQGQLYREGQYYDLHNDAFWPRTQEFDRHVPRNGQRTWTAMIYLNRVEKGGETIFPALGITVEPRPGLALIWYNLTLDGEPQRLANHRAAPVIEGRKYVITAWFRERPYIQ